MGRDKKLFARLKQKPKDFTWDELATLLKSVGYIQKKTSKTGGSRRKFVHPTAPAIILHKPHPTNIVKRYVVNDILELFKREGII